VPDSRKRNYLDALEPYRYMNQTFFVEWALGDGRWNHAEGWLQLNLPRDEWQAMLPPILPEGTDH